MNTTGTLIIVLLVYAGAAIYAYRDVYFAYRNRKASGETIASEAPSQTLRLFATLMLVALGGVMVLAGSALVFDSGNLSHPLPLDGHEVVQLLKDVVPGMISIIVGFLVLESSNRMPGGRGLRHG